MPPVFISYRREDTGGEAGRLSDVLVSHYGKDAVFLDVDAIGKGRNFLKEIERILPTCGVLLAIIGKTWTDQKDEDGNRRLDNPDDYVLLEIAAALKLDKPVIPVLVHGARMPRRDQLPDTIKELAYRNGVELTHARWRSDVDLLIEALNPYVRDEDGPPPPATPWWRSHLVVISFALAIALLGIATYVINRRSAPTTQSSPPTASTGSTTKPPPVSVPELAGLSLQDAESQIQYSHLALGGISHVTRSDKAADTVLSASLTAGDMVNPGTSINLTVSNSPPPPAAVPSQAAAASPLPKIAPVQDPVAEPAAPIAAPPQDGKNYGKKVAHVVKVPDFGGTWTPFEVSENGVTSPPNKFQLILTQDGSTVHVNNRDLEISSDGSFSFQTYTSRTIKTGPMGVPPDRADSLVTVTFRIINSVLIHEIDSQTLRPSAGNPVGTTSMTVRYHRSS